LPLPNMVDRLDGKGELSMTILQEIQATVLQYARIIAHVIKVDVEIVDENLIRIAGTGVYADRINEDMSGAGFVYKQVLQSGESQCIEEPGKHPLCTQCPKQTGCDEKLEICTPIRLGDKIIGVIGLICFTESQRNNILGEMTAYQEFLRQIADFISAKASEQQEAQRTEVLISLLKQVIDNMGKGVLVLNQQDQMVHINGDAMTQLALSRECLGQQIELQATGDSILDFEEYKVAIKGKVFFLMGQLFPVIPQVAQYAKILIFAESKTVKSEIYDLTNVGESIKLQDLLGESSAMQQLKRKLLKIATSNSTVLVTGESGTGKEMIARAIHRESLRRDKPFVAINCGAIPDALLESELFGYVKGAFTGADPRGKIGKFELANQGVIFLDEIGDMPLYLQVKLLRVLQERKISRIGSNQIIDIDVRVIAATNKDLVQMIQENKFREDLYYRLNVIPLEVPPLRERQEDIELLVRDLIKRYGNLFGKQIQGVDRQTMQILQDYPWPGNIRELENTIEFMINMVDGDTLTTEVLPRGMTAASAPPVPVLPENRVRLCSLREMEKELIDRALEVYGTSTEGKKQAAKALGIGIATLYRKLEEYGLSK